MAKTRLEQRAPADVAQTYTIERRTTDKLTAMELTAVIELLRRGTAVNPKSAAEEIPQASALILVKQDGQIVGVGAVKRSRPQYAGRIQTKSKVSFAKDLPELGYVAVAEEHRGQRLSKRIVAELLEGFGGALFATTDDERMKRTLSQFGFVEKGQNWKGDRGQLSLWLLLRS